MLDLGNLSHLLQLAVKMLFVLGALIYSIFALVVVKQTTTMTKNVNDKFNPVLIIFSYIHLVFSIFMILLTLFIL
jgi:hypothetical protein